MGLLNSTNMSPDLGFKFDRDNFKFEMPNIMGDLDLSAWNKTPAKKEPAGKGKAPAKKEPVIPGQPGRQAPPEAKRATASTYSPSSYESQGYEADNYDAVTGTAATYDADQRQVKSNETARGQMQQLLDENGRYMQSARARSSEQANARGLLNSSMAVGAGERAAIDSAMPIATQDATTYNTRSLANMDASNTSRRFNAGNEQQTDLANMNAKNASRQFNTSANNRAGEFTASAANRAGEFTANAENRAGEFNASSENQSSQFNASQENSMAQSQWSQQESQRFEEAQSKLTADLQESQIDQKAAVNLRGEFVGSYENISNEANINISEIQTSTGILAEEKSKMIDQQMRLRDADLLGLERIYEAQPQWQQNWSEVGGGESGVVSDMVAERESARQARQEAAEAEEA